MTASEVSEGKWRVYWKDSATGKRTTATVRAKSKLHAVREGLEHRRLQQAGAMSGEVVRFRQAASMVLGSNSSRREVTRAQYEKNLRLYVLPAVGDQPIDAIDGQAIEREIAELSPATQKMVRAITKTIVRESMAILGHDCPDPFRFVRVARTRLQRHDVGAPIEDLRRIASEGRLPFRLAINAGLRPSELRGLKVEDVEGDRIHVRRSRSWVRRQWVNEAPKTGRRRTVRIGHALASELASHLLDSNLDGGRYVFDLGHPSTFNKHLRTECERLGIARLRPYDLRHGCAILLARSGASILEIAKHLGHEQTSTTEIYLGSDAATEGVVVEA